MTANPNALLHRRDVVNELVRDRADLLLAFGRATWPHLLARAMLAAARISAPAKD